MDKKALLRSFLAEDAAENDITSQTLLENTYVTARIEAREGMILSGIEECVERLFVHQADASIIRSMAVLARSAVSFSTTTSFFPSAKVS